MALVHCCMLCLEAEAGAEDNALADAGEEQAGGRSRRGRDEGGGAGAEDDE